MPLSSTAYASVRPSATATKMRTWKTWSAYSKKPSPLASVSSSPMASSPWMAMSLRWIRSATWRTSTMHSSWSTNATRLGSSAPRVVASQSSSTATAVSTCTPVRSVRPSVALSVASPRVPRKSSICFVSAHAPTSSVTPSLPQSSALASKSSRCSRKAMPCTPS